MRTSPLQGSVIPSQLKDITTLNKLKYYLTSTNYVYYGLSDGTVTNQTSRVKVVSPANTFGVSALYGNFSTTSSGADNITVKASIEINGVLYPLFFSGKRSAILEPNAILETDVFNNFFSPGQVFYIRTNVQVITSGKFPIGAALNGDIGEGYVNGLDYTDSGPIGSTYTYGAYFPLGIKGVGGSVVKSVGIIGDSISVGNFDPYGHGYLIRGLSPLYGIVNVGNAGENALGFLSPASYSRIKILENVSHAIVNYGTNDITGGLAFAKTNLQLLWNYLSSMGVKVYQCTTTPRTTSTDAWATLGNQTSASSESDRKLLNAWIRSIPAPLSGIFEITDIVESARDSGLWKAGYTVDGVHPGTSTIYTTIANAIDW